MLTTIAIIVWLIVSVPFGIVVGKAMGHGLGSRK